MHNSNPLITIITVCRNSEKTIAKTIRSVISQTFKNIEYIIIDGASTDSTQDIIKKHEQEINYYQSGPDKGIYDAMNKGIDAAKGAWLVFLNSDDTFWNENTLLNVSNVIASNQQSDFIYGKIAVVENDRLLYYIGQPIRKADYWHPTKYMCHQAVFFRKTLFETYGKFQIDIVGGISDYVWFVKYLNSIHRNVFFMDEVISIFTRGGYSVQHIWDAYFAHLTFAKEYFPLAIRFKFYCMYPELFIKFNVLRLHTEPGFIKLYRRLKYARRAGKQDSIG